MCTNGVSLGDEPRWVISFASLPSHRLTRCVRTPASILLQWYAGPDCGEGQLCAVGFAQFLVLNIIGSLGPLHPLPLPTFLPLINPICSLRSVLDLDDLCFTLQERAPRYLDRGCPRRGLVQRRRACEDGTVICGAGPMSRNVAKT